jgi:hypothetical protein
MGRCIEAVCNNGCSVTIVCQSCCSRKTFPLRIFRFMFPVSQQTLSLWFWNGWQVDQLKSLIPQIFWTHTDKFARGSWAVRSCMGRLRTLCPWWCQEHSLSCSWISEEGDHLKSEILSRPMQMMGQSFIFQSWGSQKLCLGLSRMQWQMLRRWRQQLITTIWK